MRFIHDNTTIPVPRASAVACISLPAPFMGLFWTKDFVTIGEYQLVVGSETKPKVQLKG